MSGGWDTMNDTSNNDDAWGSTVTSNNKDAWGSTATSNNKDARGSSKPADGPIVGSRSGSGITQAAAGSSGSISDIELKVDSISLSDPVLPPGDGVEGPVVDGWVERKPYDYETYATPDRDPEAPRGEPTGQWAASGRRYEWKEEYGDVAPRDEALELMLFGEVEDTPQTTSSGIQFERFVNILTKMAHLNYQREI
jgi:hypothetical protein